jgi:Ser/Thr protein kinase RdoA (MazF antagonist)
MAAHTDIPQTAVVSILANYDLGGYRSSKPILHGTVQTNLLLHTTQGRFVLKYYENRSRNKVLFETDLLRYLNDRHFPCPAAFPNTHGDYVGTYKGKPYVIFEFVEGRHLKHPSATQKRALIRKVAELHNLTRAYQSRYAKYSHCYGIDTCRTLARGKAKAIGTLNAKNKLKWYEGELSKLSLPKSLPKGVCHCDFHFSNVLFTNGKFNALIDFDDANYTFLTFDLAALIDPVVWSFDHNTWPDFKTGEPILDFREARKIISEYMKHRPLRVVEQKHLFDVLKLSILFDCIWRFARGDAEGFFERRKIESLNALGRSEFRNRVFA